MTTRQSGGLRRLRDGVRQTHCPAVTERNGLLAGALAEGLDRSATLGAEKRQAREGWHRSISGLSFRRGVLSRMSQDKPMQRARSCEPAALLHLSSATLVACPVKRRWLLSPRTMRPRI